jgi:hypothetical protein
MQGDPLDAADPQRQQRPFVLEPTGPLVSLMAVDPNFAAWQHAKAGPGSVASDLPNLDGKRPRRPKPPGLPPGPGWVEATWSTGRWRCCRRYLRAHKRPDREVGGEGRGAYVVCCAAQRAGTQKERFCVVGGYIPQWGKTRPVLKCSPGRPVRSRRLTSGYEFRRSLLGGRHVAAGGAPGRTRGCGRGRPHPRGPRSSRAVPRPRHPQLERSPAVPVVGRLSAGRPPSAWCIGAQAPAAATVPLGAGR